MTTAEEAKIREADKLIRDVLDLAAVSAVANLIEVHGILIDLVTPDEVAIPEPVSMPGKCHSCSKWGASCRNPAVCYPA